MKKCEFCGFLDLPSATSCLRCSEAFPYEPPFAGPTEIAGVLEAMEELARSPRESAIAAIIELLRQEGGRLVKRVGSRTDDQARKGLGMAGASMDALSLLLQEATLAQNWHPDDWEAWLDEAYLAEEEYLEGWNILQPETPPANLLMGRGKWVGASTESAGLDSPLL